MNQLNNPRSLLVGKNETLYISDGGERILRKIVI
jgi:hypothetical protein